MIIKKITLYNFRQYKGEHHISFSTDKEKNVTVILGVNTSGKTTLVQAFNWCLYEKSAFRSRDVINVEVAKAIGMYSTQEVYVEVALIHEDKEFIIRRTQEYSRNDADRIRSSRSVLSVQYKEKTGGMQNIPKAKGINVPEDLYMKETINKILPESLSDYFFFDGERISDINNRGDVVAAVRGLMGLDVISSAMDRLDPSKASSVTSKLSSELDVGNDQKSNKYKSDLADAQKQLEGYIQRRDAVKEEIEFFERRKQELTSLLLANKEVKENQKRKSDLERDVSVITKNIVTTENRLRNDFSIGTMNFFALPLIKRALSVIEDAKQDGEGIPEMRTKAMDHILERGYCICGCDLKKNEGAKESILHEKSLLPPQHMGTILRTHKQAYQRFSREAQGFHSIITDNFTNYRSNVILLDEKNDALDSVSKQIKGVVDVAKIEQDYQKNEQDLRNKRDLLLKIMSNIGTAESEISSFEKRIESLALVSEKNQKLSKSIAYAKAVFEWFKKGYDKQEKEVKERLLESVNNIFEKMYHGKRTVTINEKYQINLITMVGDQGITTDESKGLESVKNFSFISGLVDLARTKARLGTVIENEGSISIIDDDGELMVSTEPYPLIMDAPFSNVDEIHINNIAKIIPEVAEQVILILMNKDWEFAKSSLENKIGCSYYIEKNGNSDTNSSIRRIS
jgi:DNA sulfur modification protein DndD